MLPCGLQERARIRGTGPNRVRQDCPQRRPPALQRRASHGQVDSKGFPPYHGELHTGMKIAIKLEPMDVNSIPFQEASLDIWEKKYRLTAKDGTPIDRSMDDTYQRVARALADVERE